MICYLNLVGYLFIVLQYYDSWTANFYWSYYCIQFYSVYFRCSVDILILSLYLYMHTVYIYLFICVSRWKICYKENQNSQNKGLSSQSFKCETLTLLYSWNALKLPKEHSLLYYLTVWIIILRGEFYHKPASSVLCSYCSMAIFPTHSMPGSNGYRYPFKPL